MKKLVGSSAVALAGLVLFSGVALAAPAETTPVDLVSDLSIEFAKEDDNVTKGPYSNNLSFTWAPKGFAFGKQVADFSNNAEYKLESGSAGRQFVVVNDDRKADDNLGKGWKVAVKMAPITNTEVGSTQTVSGNLSLVMDDVKYYNMGTATNVAGDDIQPAEPNEAGAVQDWTTAGKTAPTDVFLAGGTTALTGTTLEIAPDTETTVMNQAQRDATRGNEGYASKIKEASIKFTDVDNTVVGKKFATKLTWTLTRDLGV